MTPADLRALADSMDAEAVELALAGDVGNGALKMRDAIRLRALADEAERLTIGKGGRRIRSMSAVPAVAPTDPNVKRGMGRATRKHPAQQAFYKAKKSIKNVADELGENQKTVSAWMAQGEGNRAIPRHHAETLLKRYGVPLGVWKRIRD